MPIEDTGLAGTHCTTSKGPGAADPESCALLLAIFRLATEDQPQNISQLVEKVRNWNSFFQLAREHGVLPMLFPRLSGYGLALPADVENRLRAEYERNVLQCLVNATELIAILSAFNSRNIPALPYKGVSLAAMAYQDLSARPAGDLDLLVHPRDIAQASSILFERGFTRLTHIHADGAPIIQGLHEYQFERTSDWMQLELRWKLDLEHPGFRRNLGMEWMWPSRRIVNFAGAEIPNLNPEITLLVLCMHGSKHGWPRLIWILDVAQLLLSFPMFDWNEAIREGKKTGLSRTLALGVLLAHRVIGVNVPESLLHRFASDSSISILAQQIQEALFDLGSSALEHRTGYKVQLMEFSDRIRYLFSLEPLRPNDADRAMLPLPKPLHGLYYLIRPFRILRDRVTK